MREIRTPGLMSGDGKRDHELYAQSTRAHPRLYVRLSGAVCQWGKDPPTGDLRRWGAQGNPGLSEAAMQGSTNRSAFRLFIASIFIGVMWIGTEEVLRAQVVEIDIGNSFNGYFGETVHSGRVYTFESDTRAEAVVDRILEVQGLKSRTFTTRAAAVPNASATIRYGQRLLLYNPSFMYEMERRTGSQWAAISIMAHEIGHHLQGHTLEAGGSRPSIELEADDFSGFVLEKLDASLDDAQVAMTLLPNDGGSVTHPRKEHRLAAIAAGWHRARDQRGGGERRGGQSRGNERWRTQLQEQLSLFTRFRGAVREDYSPSVINRCVRALDRLIIYGQGILGDDREPDSSAAAQMDELSTRVEDTCPGF